MLTVEGTINDDLMTVFRAGGDYHVYNGSTLVGTYAAAGVQAVRINGYAGNDVLFGAAARVNMLLDGGLGNDVLFGGNARNVLVGGAGVDVVFGGRGQSFLIAGAVTDAAAQDQAFAAWAGSGRYADRATAVNALLRAKVTASEGDILFGLSPFDLYYQPESHS